MKAKKTTRRTSKEIKFFSLLPDLRKKELGREGEQNSLTAREVTVSSPSRTCVSGEVQSDWNTGSLQNPG